MSTAPFAPARAPDGVSPAPPTPAGTPLRVPALPTDAVLATVRDATDRLRLAYGAGREAFARDVQPLLAAYAAYVHLLPASPAHAYAAPGGLLRRGLDTAYLCLQGADGHLGPAGQTLAQRQAREPRWRRAACLAGLASALHTAIGALTVTTPAGVPWPALATPLSAWLAHERIRHYLVHWRPAAPDARALTLLALPHIVPPAYWHTLAPDEPALLAQLAACLAGVPALRADAALDGLVRRATALVVERDLQAHASGAPLPYAEHVADWLVDALRQTIAHEPTWATNADKSCVAVGTDGAFLRWPDAAVALRATIVRAQWHGVPTTAPALLAVLAEADLLLRQPDGNLLWPVALPPYDEHAQAVRLATPAVLFGHTVPAPLTRAVALPPPVPAVPVGPLPRRAAAAPPPAANVAAPATADLFAPPAASSSAAPAAAPVAPAMAPVDAPRWRVAAPARLDAAVGAALDALLNAPARDEVRRDPATGHWCIAPAAFAAHAIAPARAVRALAQAHMLVPDTRAPGGHAPDGATPARLVLDGRHVYAAGSPAGERAGGRSRHARTPAGAPRQDDAAAPL